MAFDAGTLIARLKLDRKEFVAGLQGARADVKKFDAAAGALFRGGAMVAGITFATKRIYDMTKAAAGLEEVSTIFDRMAGSTANANKILRDTGAVARSLSQRDMKELGNRLELVGIGMERLPQMARIAESIADATGGSTKQVLDTLISGSARASDRMLRLIGINIELTKGLSEEAAQVEFLNKLMAEGDRIVTKYGTSSESAADQVDSLGSAFRDLSDAMNSVLLKIKVPEMMGFLALVLRGKAPMLTPFGNIFGFMNKAPKAGSAGDPMGPPSPFSGDGGIFRLLQQAAADMKAAAAFIAGGDATARGARRTGEFAGPLGIDQGGVNAPDITFGNAIAEQTDIGTQGFRALSDAAAGFFEMLVTDSANAGRAFFSGLMNGLAGIASNLGDLYIKTGIGMLGIMQLNPFATIAAGIALKAISGVMRGVAYNNAPITTATGDRHFRQPMRDTTKEQAGVTFIVQGDFNGDKVWIDRLAERLRAAQRERGVEVVFAG